MVRTLVSLPSALLALVLAAGACAGDAEDAPLDPGRGDTNGKAKVRGRLGYGQAGKGAFRSDGFDAYVFDAIEGDVVSLFLTGVAPGLTRIENTDTLFDLFHADSDDPTKWKFIERFDDISPSNPKAQMRDFAVPKTGRYGVVVGARASAGVSYRLRLSCTGGACEPEWQFRDATSCQLSRIGGAIESAVRTNSELSRDPLALERQLDPLDRDFLVTTRNAAGPVLLARAKRESEASTNDALYEFWGDWYPTIIPGMADLIANAKFEVDLRLHKVDDLALPSWLDATPGIRALVERVWGEQLATPADPLNDILDAVAQMESRLAAAGRHGDPAIVRIVVDAFEIGQFKDDKLVAMLHTEFHSLNLDPALVKVEIAAHHHLAVAEDHSKIAIVDGRYIHIGGQNPSANNHYSWAEHDTGFLLKGEVARAALADFDNSWRRSDTDQWSCEFDKAGVATPKTCRKIAPLPPTHRAEVDRPDLDDIGLPATACLPMIYLGNQPDASVTSHELGHPIAQGWLTAFNSAQRLMRIESPNFDQEDLFFSVMNQFGRHPDMRIQITIPKFRNDEAESLPFGGGTNTERREVLEDLLEQRFAQIDAAGGQYQYRWHPIPNDGPGAQHTKYGSFDQEVAIIGTTNMNRQSLTRAREVSIVIDDPAVTKRYDQQVFLPDFCMSEPNLAHDDGVGFVDRDLPPFISPRTGKVLACGR